MALPEYPKMSVKDYLILANNATDACYEYLDGELRMLVGGTSYHGKIAMNIAGMLYAGLHDGPCSIYSSDVRLQLSESHYVYPDLSVSCDPRDDQQEDMIRYPRLIIEVLSPSTEMIDRVKKLAYYQACDSIQEYVMIDSQKYLIEVYHRESEKKWIYEKLGLKDTLELESLHLQIAVKEIYRKVTFA